MTDVCVILLIMSPHKRASLQTHNKISRKKVLIIISQFENFDGIELEICSTATIPTTFPIHIKHVFTGVPKISNEFSREYAESPSLKRSTRKSSRFIDPNIWSLISSVSGSLGSRAETVEVHARLSHLSFWQHTSYISPFWQHKSYVSTWFFIL